MHSRFVILDSAPALFRASLLPAIVLLILLVELARPQLASAHARLDSSTPASGSALAVAPTAFVLTFSEEIELGFSGASLLAVDGSSVPLGPLSVSDGGSVLTVPLADPGTLANGTYTLVWRAYSAVDSHVTTGVIAFSVGTGTTPSITGMEEARPPWWRIAINWLELAALAALTGFAAFSLLVASRAFADLRVVLLRAAQLAAAAALLAVLLTGYDLGLSATGARLFDAPGLTVYRDIITDSRAGRAWLVRFACAVAIALVVVSPRHRLFASSMCLATGVVALGSLAASGHAAAASPPWRAILSHWLHISSVAVWLGALFFLWLSLRALAGTEKREPPSAVLVTRFSRLGLAAVAVIVVSGVIRFAAEVSGPRNLVDSDYGRVLIGKHLLVVALLIAAGVNQLLLVPRIRRDGDSPDLFGSVCSYAGIELTVAAVILFASAALTELPPANAPLAVSVASRPLTIDQRAPADDLSVWLLARLTGASSDRYTITITDTNRRPPAELQRVIVESQTSAGETEAGDRFVVEQLSGSPGTFAFPALRLGLPGLWGVDVVVRRAGMEDVTASFQIDTSAAAQPPPRLIDDDWRMPRLTLPAWLLGFVAFASLIGGVVLTRVLRWLEPLAAGIILTMTALIAGGFAIQAYRQAVPVSAGSDLTNPVSVDGSSIRRGESTYRAFCLECHGPNAGGIEAGDPLHGHSGSNLLDEPTQRQRDGDLYWAMTQGVGGTEMPAYDIALTESERWDLVNYLRSLDQTESESEAESS